MQHLVCAIFIFQTRSRACLKKQYRATAGTVFYVQKSNVKIVQKYNFSQL